MSDQERPKNRLDTFQENWQRVLPASEAYEFDQWRTSLPEYYQRRAEGEQSTPQEMRPGVEVSLKMQG